jgi:hypothetical protein
MKLPTFLKWLGWLSLVALLAWGSFEAVYLVNAARAKESLTSMSQLSTILQAEEPSNISSSALLSEFLSQRGFNPDILIDGWGHPLQIERIHRADQNLTTYRIRSFGRDGEPGPCCAGVVPRDWDTDVVVENGVWKQLWSGFGRAEGYSAPRAGASR